MQERQSQGRQNCCNFVSGYNKLLYRMFTRQGSFWLTALLLFSMAVNAQTLDTPNFTVLPCYGQAGLSHYIEVQPVTGASGYLWGGNTFQINGQLPPEITTIPNAIITYNTTPDSAWKLCVWAVNSWTTSPPTASSFITPYR